MIARRVAGLLWAALAGAAPLAAQRVAVEGVAALELWQTDSGSRLLARNGGDPAYHAGVFGWAVVRPTERVELLALGYVEAGTVEDDRFATTLEVLEARLRPFESLTLSGGRIAMPVGGFTPRRFAHTNPVIGAPDMYPPLYPWGALAAGRIGPFDYRAAAVSLPVVNPNYSPEPAHRLRPVVGAGVTLGPALHVGVAWTSGPYLGPESNAALPAGTAWDDYAQTVVAADLRFSVGYVETRAELAWSSYEVPTLADEVEGLGWYVEPRVTLSPRVFVAARVERFDYAFIRAFGTSWVGRPTLQENAELGVGYRFSRAALLKVSARGDHWPGPDPSPQFHAPDGYAVAAQFSWQFSLLR